MNNGPCMPHHHLAILVQQLEPHFDDADVGTRARSPRAQRRAAHAQAVARPDRPQPVDLLDPGRPLARRAQEERVAIHPHHQRRAVPARGASTRRPPIRAPPLRRDGTAADRIRARIRRSLPRSRCGRRIRRPRRAGNPRNRAGPCRPLRWRSGSAARRRPGRRIPCLRDGTCPPRARPLRPCARRSRHRRSSRRG